jgi:chitodextrinase
MKLLSIVAVFSIAACGLQAQSYAPRVNFGAKLEPQGALMHGAGQDPTAFAAYTGVMPAGRQPMVYMYYIVLKGLTSTWSDDLRTHLAVYPNAFIIPQIGLTMTDGVTNGVSGSYEAQVAAGAYDQQIANLVTGLQRLATPAYLRIGYEFNGVNWNGYKPATYQQAFIRITNAIRAANLEVATVWDASGDAADDGVTDYLDYYPGDQYVDWFGMNMYGVSMFAQDPAITPFFAMAVAHQKPVMLAEESPRPTGAQNGATSWNDWFAQFFAFMQATPVVKQFDYIDWNWANYPQWSTWGDARLETTAGAYVRNLYIADLADPVLLNAGSETAFRKLLGYNDTTPPPAVTDLSASSGAVLTWTPVQDPSGIARYYIYRDGAFLTYALGPGVEDTTAAVGTTYSYTVAAMDRAGNLAAPSNAAVVTVSSIEMLLDNGFANGLGAWLFETFSSGAVGSAVVDTANPIDGSPSVRLTVSQSTGTAWHLQLRQYFNMTQGLTYAIRFKAQASAPVGLPYAVQLTASPYTTYFSQTAAVGVSTSQFESLFVAPASGQVEVEFNFGNINPNTVWLGDISVQEQAEMLLDDGFENGLGAWLFETFSSGAVGSAVVDTANPIDGSASLRLTVSQSTGTAWHLQLRQYFNMTQGLTYAVGFKARASAAVGLPYAVQQTASPYTTYFGQTAAVGVNTSQINSSFVAPVSGQVEMEFNFGNINPNTVWLDDVSVLALVAMCNVSLDPVTTVADAQTVINEALGISRATSDLNGDGVVNVTDVQIVTNAALGLGCRVR